MDGVRDGNLGRGLGIPTLFFLGATGLRASCAVVCRVISFVLPLLIAEKNHLSFVYVLAKNVAIQTALFLYASERSTGCVMDSDDSLSYTEPIVGFTVILHSTS